MNYTYKVCDKKLVKIYYKGQEIAAFHNSKVVADSEKLCKMLNALDTLPDYLYTVVKMCGDATRTF